MNHNEHTSHKVHKHERLHKHTGHEANHETHKTNHSHHINDFKRRFFISLILTIPVLILSEMIQIWFGFRVDFPLRRYVVFVLATGIFFYGGWPFLSGMVDEVKRKGPGMMTLIGMAISVAFIYSSFTVFSGQGKDFFWELATLVDVMLLGHWIEAKSIMGASRALEELVKVMPKMAHLIKNGEIVDVSVSTLKKGDIVLVKPGEKIPSDGVVIEGESYVNESLLTGESKPVSKRNKDKVIGGSINEEGVLEIRIEKTGEDTYISQIIKFVKEAQESKSKTQDIANKAAGLLFYIALVAGIITYIIWIFYKGPDFALERSVTVLVIACPHALGLAVPLVVAISTSLTATRGILIRDRRAFENLRNVNAVVFDKTGTLTLGKFKVSSVVSFTDEEEVLKLTLGLEANSEHIIAKEIVRYAKDRGISAPYVKEFNALPGKGVYGKVEGKEVYVGNESLLEDLGIKIEDEEIERLKSQGRTPVFVLSSKKLLGVIFLADEVREESREAVERLKKTGIDVFMLTGDIEEVADRVSKELGIDEYFARVLPHKKQEKIKILKEKGYRVAMVGDGINDAPALVTADVGIAIGAGTDVAIESADIILVKNNPRDVVEAINLSRETYKKMVQNLWWAAGYNTIAIPLAGGILASIGFFLSPAVGAMLMSLSTVIVAINAQTLNKLRIQ